jgi:hypothetical protein
VSRDAACHCPRRVDAAVRLGRIRPGDLEFVDADAEREASLVDANDQIGRLHDAAHLLRALPAAVPATSRERISAVLAASGVTR